MRWDDFYNGHFDWADSTIRSRLSTLEDMGPGSEIVEVVEDIDDMQVRSALIRKSMKLGAVYSREDYCWLEPDIPRKLFEELGAYAGFDPNDPEDMNSQFPPDALPLDEVYERVQQLNREITPKPKPKGHYLKAFLIALLGGGWRKGKYHGFRRR